MALRVSSRYAKSLLTLANEMNVLADVNKDAEQLLADLKATPELRSLFNSPIVAVDKKNATVDAIYAGKLHDLTIQFIRLLISKKRESGVLEIFQEFQNQYRALHKIGKLVITSATQLSDTQKATLSESVKNALGMQEMVVEEKIDSDIIGGFILNFSDKKYDASVRSALDNIEASFNKNLYIENY